MARRSMTCCNLTTSKLHRVCQLTVRSDAPRRSFGLQAVFCFSRYIGLKFVQCNYWLSCDVWCFKMFRTVQPIRKTRLCVVSKKVWEFLITWLYRTPHGVVERLKVLESGSSEHSGRLDPNYICTRMNGSIFCHSCRAHSTMHRLFNEETFILSQRLMVETNFRPFLLSISRSHPPQLRYPTSIKNMFLTS